MATRKKASSRPRKTARKKAAPKKAGAKRATTRKSGASARRATSTKRAGASRKTPARKPAARKPAARKPAKRKPARRKPAAPAPAAKRALRPGFISHTGLASSDPNATVEWCRNVFGWNFVEPMPTPNGPYHMWQFGDNMGGGIRTANSPEMPGTVPYCEVPDIQDAYDRAVGAGATSMMPPNEIPGDNGWIAVVSAPGGVTMGLWAPGRGQP